MNGKIIASSCLMFFSSIAHAYTIPEHSLVPDSSLPILSPIQAIGSDYMTKYWPYIKNTKLKDMYLVGSHHATYQAGPAWCHPQDESLATTVAGGVRHADVRLKAKVLYGPKNVYNAFHGKFCPSENEDFFDEIETVKNAIGLNDILIFHVKKFDDTSNNTMREFNQMIRQRWGGAVITPVELNSVGLKLNTATLSQLRQFGRILFIQHESSNVNYSFYFPKRKFREFESANSVFGFTGNINLVNKYNC